MTKKLEMQEAQKEYDDWVLLLKAVNATELLDDPYNVWIEAWTIATLLAEQKHGKLDQPSH